MTYTTSYSGLVAEVQDFCEDSNDEFVARLPDMIARACDMVQRDLGLARWRTIDTSITVSPGVYILTRDASWLVVHSVSFPTLSAYCDQRLLDYVKRAGSSNGTPKYLAEVSDSQIRVAPPPSTSVQAEVEVTKRMTRLSTSNETNWLTNNAADLLLLATLINAEAYLVAPERVAEFTALYTAILESARKELRAAEKANYEPIRAAPQPTLTPGASA